MQPVALSIHYCGISVDAADHERDKHEEGTVAAHGGCSTSTLRSVLLSPRIRRVRTQNEGMKEVEISSEIPNLTQIRNFEHGYRIMFCNYM